MDNPTATPRVLYVEYSVGFGGAQKSLALLVSALDGTQPLLLTSQNRRDIEKLFTDCPILSYRTILNYRNLARFQEWGARVHWVLGAVTRLAARAADRMSLFTGALYIAGLILWKRVSIVHLNNGCQPVEVIVAARLTRTPVVAHMRGEWADLGRLGWWAVRHTAHVIAISRSVLERSRLQVHAPAVPTTVVHNPVNMPSASVLTTGRRQVRNRHGIEDDEIVVACFGRIVAWKGQLEFVQACILAMEDNDAIRPMIVGGDSEWGSDYGRHVMDIAATSRHAERFIWSGYQEKVDAYYAAADIVVHSSIEAEPFGRVVIEGMAAAKPVIAMSEGGPVEIIRNGHDGLLVEPRSVVALSNAIADLASDRDKRLQLAKNAVHSAANRFDVGSHGRAVSEVYGRVLAKR